MRKVIECVPNFSEGNNKEKINEIIAEINAVPDVYVLHKDMGLAANRTVITFAGAPESVVEAAFRAIKKSLEVIDMRVQKGVHPRIGATDVCPLVPVSGMSMEETILWAHRLAKRVGEELGIPVYCYGNAAFFEERRNLANIRKEQYEGLPEKIKTPEGQPDFGPAAFIPRFGAVAIGARDFLIAYNIDLETTSVAVARTIAREVREYKYPGGTNTKDLQEGQMHSNPGLKAVKAIGWYIEEYGNAQVSINLTNFRTTPIYKVFERVKSEAEILNTTVTGSEIIGLVPLEALTEVGKFYTRDDSLPELQLVEAAIHHLGLNLTNAFPMEEKILEYAMKNTGLLSKS